MTQEKWQDTLVSSERATSHESLYNKTITTKGYPAHAAYT